MSTWNAQNNHFPPSTGALGQRSLQGQSRAIRTAFQNFGGIEVGMLNVAAKGATETLCGARARIDVPADGAGLRAVSCRDFDQLPTLPGELVAKHLDQAPPAGAEDSPSEPGIGADHIVDLKTLDDHTAVALGIGARERVQDVLALPAYLAVQPVDASDGFLSFPGSFLAARDDALDTGKPFQGAFEVSRVGNELSIGVADQIVDSAVECHDRPGLGSRFGHFELTENRDEPLVSLPPQGTGLRRPSEWSVNDRPEIAQLGKAHDGTVETPELRVRLGETEKITAFALPPWGAGELFETALPGLVELDEQLRADVTWHIGEPGQLGAQGRKFVDLIERRAEDALIARTGETHLSLLEGKVPEEAQRAFPSEKPRFLRGRGKRVLDSEETNNVRAPIAATSHRWRSPSRGRETAFPTTARKGFLPDLMGGVSAPEI